MNLTARHKMLEYLLIGLLMHLHCKVCDKSRWVPKTSSCQRIRILRPCITFPSSFSIYKWKTELLIVSDQPKAAWHCQRFPTTPNQKLSIAVLFFLQTKHQHWRLKSSSGMFCPYLLPCFFFLWWATPCTDISMLAKRNTLQIWWVFSVAGIIINPPFQASTKGSSDTGPLYRQRGCKEWMN